MHPALEARLPVYLEGGGELEITGRLLQASNVTLLATLTDPETKQGIDCVYKPIRGERPLWDFPDGTLALREVAAYEVSRAGGFDLVPVTVLVDGPLGPGSLQAWVDVEDDTEELIDLVPAETMPRDGWFTCVEGYGADETPVAVIHADHDQLRLMAVLDALINNADRKGGHILNSRGGVFGVDHGISFHTEPKLRTLLWGWAGTELNEAELACVERAASDAPPVLRKLLAEDEVEAFLRRVARLLGSRRFPRPRADDHRTVPWPPF